MAFAARPVSLPYGFTLFSNEALQRLSGKTVSLPYGFTLFSNPLCLFLGAAHVSLPYGFTLFSNILQHLKGSLKVSLPYGFTLFSNTSFAIFFAISFHYLMDLHYSQTMGTNCLHRTQFHYLMDLHYSQTLLRVRKSPNLFHYLMDLHYSQTDRRRGSAVDRFTTLWIYTILKLKQCGRSSTTVSLPYGFTLFSNKSDAERHIYPFHYLMDLHYSQTGRSACSSPRCFTTLWIYTILKQSCLDPNRGHRFTTLWIYTILKRLFGTYAINNGFTTLWIYTILKRRML